jgi:hypothetical protein
MRLVNKLRLVCVGVVLASASSSRPSKAETPDQVVPEEGIEPHVGASNGFESFRRRVERSRSMTANVSYAP